MPRRARPAAAARDGEARRARRLSKMLLPMLALASLAGVAGYLVWPTEAPGFANGYAYRRAIEINSAYVAGSGSHTDFPVLFSGTFPYLRTVANGGKVETDNGYDIIFSTSTEGVELLDFEIEKYSSTTGEIAAWIRLPNLSTSATTTFYMFYGSSTISASLERASTTWDTNYKGVWHFSETSGQQFDSTANNNDTSSIVVTAQGTAAGVVAGANNYDGVNDAVTIPDSASLDLTNGGTIEAWIKTNDVATSTTQQSVVTAPAPSGLGAGEYGSFDSVMVGDTVYYASLYCSGTVETFSVATSTGGNFSGWTTKTAPDGCGAGDGAAISLGTDGSLLYYLALTHNDTVETISFATSTLDFTSFSAWNTSYPGPVAGTAGIDDQSGIDMVIDGDTAYVGLLLYDAAPDTEDYWTTNFKLDGSSAAAWTDQTNDPIEASNAEGCSTAVETDGASLFYRSWCHEDYTYTPTDRFMRSTSTFSGTGMGAWVDGVMPPGPQGVGNHESSNTTFQIVRIGNTLYYAAQTVHNTDWRAYSGNSSPSGNEQWASVASGVNATNRDDGAASLTTDGFHLYQSFANEDGTAITFRRGTSTLTSHPILFKDNAFGIVQAGSGYVLNEYPRVTAFGTTTAPSAFEHVAITYDGTWVRMYINGEEKRAIKTNADFNATAADLVLGKGTSVFGDNFYFNGVIDEVRISDTARSADWLKTQYNNITSTSTFYWIGSEVTDTTPPTPDPMTFATPPGGGDPTALVMEATKATDDSIPIEYFFSYHPCASNGGTGGTQSGWQTSTSYTDTGLQGNKCYGYRVAARDRLGNTTASSSLVEVYTAAYTPGAPTVSAPTASTLTLTNNENGNPAANPTTYFAVRVLSTSPPDVTWLNRYVDVSGNPSITPVWLTDAQIDGLVVQGLQSGTTYGFAVKARNQDGKETPFSSEGSGTTSGSAPAADVDTRLRGARLRGGERLR